MNKQIRKNKFARTIIGIMALLLSAHLFADSPQKNKPLITQIAIFGDSLSDDGNLYHRTLGIGPKKSKYYNGRFTNDPGTWTDYLESDFNSMGLISHSRSKSHKNFIINYSIGGATTYDYDDNLHTIKNISQFEFNASQKLVQSIHQQITNYISHNTVNSHSLGMIWTGANDFLWAGAWAQGFHPNIQQANYNTITQYAEKGILDALATLKKAGMTHIILAGTPNITLTPKFIHKDYSNSFKNVIWGYIQNYNQFLKHLHISGLHIIYIDPAEIMQSFMHSGEYSNITDACLTSDTPSQNKKHDILISKNDSEDYLLHTKAGLGKLLALLPIFSQDNNFNSSSKFALKLREDHYLYWDDVHPTSITHARLERILKNDYLLKYFRFNVSKFPVDTVQIKNNGGYVLKATYTDANGNKASTKLTLGIPKTIYVKDNTDILYHAVLGVSKKKSNYSYHISHTMQCADHPDFKADKDGLLEPFCSNAITRCNKTVDDIKCLTKQYRVPITYSPFTYQAS